MKTKELTEAQLEKACCEYAAQKGWLSYKWASPGTRGVPDRLFFNSGRVVLAEFKALTGRISWHQLKVMHELKKQLVNIYIIRSIERFREVLDGIAQLPERNS